jgi:hypothetical protein
MCNFDGECNLSQKKQIQILIGTDGKITAKTIGFTGPDCAKEIDKLQSCINLNLESRDFTDEYYVQPSESVDEVSYIQNQELQQ